MEDTKAREFFDGVLSKTRAGRIRWQPTAEDSHYIAAIGGQFTLSIAQFERPYSVPDTSYSLTLKDQDGRELTRVTSDDAGIALREIQELYGTQDGKLFVSMRRSTLSWEN
jgi:hypothetical protein